MKKEQIKDYVLLKQNIFSTYKGESIMKTEINMNLTKEEAISINNLWFECFGEYTTIDSMDEININVSSRESRNKMNITTNSGNVKIYLDLETDSFFKILTGIEILANYMTSKNVPAEIIRQTIRNFNEVFGKDPKYKLCINGYWMCKTHLESDYEEGDEYREIYKLYSRTLSNEGYDTDYIDANLTDYVSCRIYGSKLFMQAKKKGMLGEVLGEDLNPFRNEAAEFNIENGSKGIELIRMEEEEYFRSIEEE